MRDSPAHADQDSATREWTPAFMARREDGALTLARAFVSDALGAARDGEHGYAERACRAAAVLMRVPHPPDRPFVVSTIENLAPWSVAALREHADAMAAIAGRLFEDGGDPWAVRLLAAADELTAGLW